MFVELPHLTLLSYNVLYIRDSYRGDLSAEEMAALEEAAQIKAMAISKITNREEEIIDIAEGLLLPSKKVW